MRYELNEAKAADRRANRPPRPRALANQGMGDERKRAETALKKLARQRAYYERALTSPPANGAGATA